MSGNALGRLLAAPLILGGFFCGSSAAQLTRDESRSVSADGLGNVYFTGTTGLETSSNRAAFVSKYNAEGSLQWSRNFGADEFTDCLGYGVSADALGNVFISGDGQLIPGGPFFAFITKYDAAGNLQWTTQQLSSAEGDRSRGVSADGLGNAYISGRTGILEGPSHFEAFVSKYDAAGNLQWTKQLGTAEFDESYGVSADGMGNVYISGSTDGSLGGLYAGGGDAFVAKYDAAGNLQWTRQLGTAGHDQSNGVSADGLGNVYISGETRGSLGGSNAGSSDAFITKYDAAGNLQWTKQLGTTGFDDCLGVSADGLGNAYASGLTDSSLGGAHLGDQDAFVANYDSAGNLQWTRQLGTVNVDQGYGVSADGLGNAYISGLLRSVNAFVARYDAEGNFQWTRILRENIIPEPASWLLAALACAPGLRPRRRPRSPHSCLSVLLRKGIRPV